MRPGDEKANITPTDPLDPALSPFDSVKE